jgi:hypothetical protein
MVEWSLSRTEMRFRHGNRPLAEEICFDSRSAP